MDPLGTPQTTSPLLELELFITTCWVLLLRYDLNHGKLNINY